MSNTISYSHTKGAAVSVLAYFRIRSFAIRVIENSIERSVPSSRGGHLKKEDKCFEERFEVMDVIETNSDLDMLEQTHAEYGEDEHNQEEEEADVEEGRHGHDEGEKERPDPLGALDEPENSADLDHSDHPEQGRGHKVFLNEI